MNCCKEIAKFFCGVEAFHAFIHAYFWYSVTTVNVFGVFNETPTAHMWGAIVNGVISVVLGIYAWKQYERRPAA